MKTGVKNRLTKTILISAILILAGLLTLSLSSCITIKINDIRGSGQIETKEYSVSGFETLEFSGMGNIFITQGDTETLKVEAENNVIERLKIETKGNILVIGLKNNFMNVIPTKSINFYLTVKDLRDITISGAGNVKCDGLTTSDMRILSSGLGSIEMNLVAEELKVDISGAGKVIMAGRVKTQDISISGAGSYDASDLESNDCQINISGVGKAELNAVNTLDIQMSGLGSIEYKGNPAVTQNISGGGKIKSVD